MADITLASSGDDAAILETITRSLAELAGAAAVKTTAVQTAAANGEDLARVRAELREWAQSTLLPYLRAETEVFSPALTRTGVDDVVGELAANRDELTKLLEQVGTARRPRDTAAAAAALQVVLAEHFQLQAEKALPALAENPQTSLTVLWYQIAPLTKTAGDVATSNTRTGAGGEPASEPVSQESNLPSHLAASHACACGILDEDEYPELDVRTVPHAIRHATVFGALDGISAGSGLVLVAPHDPLPLLAQIEQRSPGSFVVNYLDRGPEAWRLQFRRIEPAS